MKIKMPIEKEKKEKFKDLEIEKRKKDERMHEK